MYKFGQGYWVRVLTALTIGIFSLITAAWAVGELEAYHPPTVGWTVTYSGGTGAPAAGQAVSLQTLVDNKAVEIGTAKIESSTGGNRAAEGTVRLGGLTMTEPERYMPRDVKRLVAGPAGAAVFTATVGQVAPIAMFDKTYVQMGVGALVLLVGLGIGWRYVASKASTVDFLIATDGEMKKVNWSTRKIIMDSTSVVIGATFLIAFLIFVFDSLLNLLAHRAGLM